MQVVFRVDASSRIGHGHVMRCLALALALRDRQASVSFVSRELDGHLCDRVQSDGFAVLRLPGDGDGRHAPDPARDVALTRGALLDRGLGPAWIVVDHYGLDQRWERAMRSTASHGIFAIDDLADRPHACDLLLDQNLAAGMESRYAALVPPQAALLLGPAYALLHPRFRALHDEVARPAGPIRRLLVSFGGGDSGALAMRAVEAILRTGRDDLEVDVVVGAARPGVEMLRELVGRHRHLHLHEGAQSLAPLMARADLAIGAGGTTSWERLCLGLPAIVATVAENQVPGARALHERGLIQWVGDVGPDIGDRIYDALVPRLSRGVDPEWARAARTVVDGRGADRVAATLLARDTSPVAVRPAVAEDEMLLFAWANDPTTRANAFAPGPIPLETHQRWFRGRLGDTDGCRLYIVELGQDIPLGQVRFDRVGDAWRISYSVAPSLRGRRLGRAALGAALSKFREDLGPAPVFGQVKPGNVASCRVFESLDFDRREMDDVVEFWQRG